MKSILAILLLSYSLVVSAETTIKISNATIRLAPPGSPATAIFLSIENLSKKDISLIAVTSDIAEKFELHTMEMAGGKMVMRKVDDIKIKKGESVHLKSGGLHIMVFKLRKPLKEKDIHSINLIFNDKSTIKTDIVVEKIQQ